MPPVTPNDVYARKMHEKSVRDAESRTTPAERRARFPGEVRARLDALRASLPNRFSEPLSVAFSEGKPCDSDGGLGLAALDFTLCHDGKRYGVGSINIVDNGGVEFFDRTSVHHEPAVHLTMGQLEEDAIVDFMGRMTERHLRL